MIACYIIGEPGVGKTTLMNELLSCYQRLPEVRLGNGLFAEPLVLNEAMIGWHLGRGRYLFGGTDALPFHAHGAAVAWARNQADGTVFGEGQRLATYAFLDALADRGPLLVLHLQGAEIAAERRAMRGSAQNPTWVRAARTRAQNLAEMLPDLRIPVQNIDAGPYALEAAREAWSAFSLESR